MEEVQFKERRIESCLDHKSMVEWLEKQGFHTIKCTIDND